MRELEQAVRRILLTRRYEGDERGAAPDRAAHFAAAVDAGTLDADALLGGYCALLYERCGNLRGSRAPDESRPPHREALPRAWPCLSARLKVVGGTHAKAQRRSSPLSSPIISLRFFGLRVFDTFHTQARRTPSAVARSRSFPPA